MTGTVICREYVYISYIATSNKLHVNEQIKRQFSAQYSRFGTIIHAYLLVNPGRKVKGNEH